MKSCHFLTYQLSLYNTEKNIHQASQQLAPSEVVWELSLSCMFNLVSNIEIDTVWYPSGSLPDMLGLKQPASLSDTTLIV